MTNIFFHIFYSFYSLGLLNEEIPFSVFMKSFCRSSDKPPETYFTPKGTPIWHAWANDHDVAHLQAKTVPMNLIWSESSQWLLSSSVPKIPKAFITPIGTPIWPPWANDYNIAHLQAKAVQMHLIWSESSQWLPSSGVRQIPRVLITPTGTPIWLPRANDHDDANLQAKTVQINLISSGLVQQLWSYSIHKVGDRWTDGQKNRWTEGRTDANFFIVPLTFLRKSGEYLNKSSEILQNHQQCLMGRRLFMYTEILV